MSHEGKVSSEPFSVARMEIQAATLALGEKWLPPAQMLSQPVCDSRFTSCLPPVLHFT